MRPDDLVEWGMAVLITVMWMGMIFLVCGGPQWLAEIMHERAGFGAGHITDGSDPLPQGEPE